MISHCLPMAKRIGVLVTHRDTWLFLDFDGVLAIPYSQPEVLFPGTEELLRRLAASGMTIAVTSFNPRAYHVLKPLLDDGTICDIRAGSRVKWWEEGSGTYSDTVHRKQMNKAFHVHDMLADALPRRVVFVDDDPENAKDVNDAIYRWNIVPETHVVASYAGFGMATARSLGLL
jgi:hypothetical protein